MHRIRRSWATVSVLLATGLLCVIMSLTWNSGESRSFFTTQSVTPIHPALTAMVVGRTGQPLTRVVNQKALIVVPSRLPGWARQELHRRYPKAMSSSRTVLWNGNSSFFKKALQWNVSGLYPVRTHVVVPATGIPHDLITLVARQHGAWSRRAWTWTHHGFEAPLKTVHVALSPSLMETLSPLMPSGSSVSVVNGQGEILAQLANPTGRELSWQPRPVGEILTPALLAMALAHPRLFSGLSPKQPGLLNVIDKRWGQVSIHNALKALGLGRGTTVCGQPVLNPSLPEGPVSVFPAGSNLWATTDEVARAYLVLADTGNVPHLSWDKAEGKKALKRLTTEGAVNEIEQVLPQELVGKNPFYVWRPGNHMAVAYTHAGGGLVMVIQGSATAQIVSLVQQVALWAHLRE